MQKLFHYYNEIQHFTPTQFSVCKLQSLQCKWFAAYSMQLQLQSAGSTLLVPASGNDLGDHIHLIFNHAKKSPPNAPLKFKNTRDDQFLRQNSSLSSENFFFSGTQKGWCVWEIIKGCNLYGNRLCRTTDIEEIEIPNKQKWKI